MKRSGGRRRSDSAPQQSRWVLALSCLVGSDGLASSLSLDRGPVVLGRTESVGVTLQVEEAPGEEDRPLRLAINVGSFGEITRVKPGVYRTVYVPPPTRFPQVALVALWRETGSEAPIEFLRFSLYGLTQVPISAKPGAEVTVAIEADTFGPVISDSRGKATVQVAVPPNVHDAAVKVKERGGAIAERKVPIEVPPYNRLTASLVPHAILADGKSWARLDVSY
ncbi:MAG: hypothetical protein HYZ28_17440, partial [Myxococcales bacterium]|nr:hypothetical protein [Myxococcales bacterium]